MAGKPDSVDSVLLLPFLAPGARTARTGGQLQSGRGVVVSPPRRRRSVAQSLRPPDSHFDFWPLSGAAAPAPVSRSFTHLQFPSRSFPPLPSPPSILPSLPTSLLPIQIIADLFRCCLPPSLGLCKICRIEIRGTFSSAANANTEVLPLML